MEKLHPRAIIFDLGSTLIEYETVPWDELSQQCASSAREFLVKSGSDVPGEEEFIKTFNRIRQAYRQRAAETLVEWNVMQVGAELLGEFNVELDDGFLDRFFDAYYVPVEKRIFAYDDVVDTLAKLKPEYPVMGLVSNTVFPERAHLKELDRFGIGPYLSFSLFSSTFNLRKPHKDIFYKAANLAGCAPSECVYVGDRYVEDIQGPNAIGMPAILKLNPVLEYPAEMPLAVRRINTLSELFNHIDI